MPRSRITSRQELDAAVREVYTAWGVVLPPWHCWPEWVTIFDEPPEDTTCAGDASRMDAVEIRKRCIDELVKQKRLSRAEATRIEWGEDETQADAAE